MRRSPFSLAALALAATLASTAMPSTGQSGNAHRATVTTPQRSTAEKTRRQSRSVQTALRIKAPGWSVAQDRRNAVKARNTKRNRKAHRG